MTDQPISQPPSPFADLDPEDYVLAFAAVPTRARHDGWTAERQRRFVLILRETGVVAYAARAVGCTHQSAYKLRHHPGGGGFAAAWDRALDEGRTRAFELAYDRAINGYRTALFYRGRYVGTAHRYDNRLAMAALNGMERRAPAKREQ
ncbi:MAG: hypothetical protein ABIS14_06240 [Sphingomonas sp.]